MTKKRPKPSDEDQLIRIATEEGYRYPAVVEGVCCALHPFVTTWGLVIGIDATGYERRYCYEHYNDAMKALGKLTNPKESHATGPWIKCKGTFRGEPIDLLNPELFITTPDGLPKRLQDEKIPSARAPLVTF